VFFVLGDNVRLRIEKMRVKGLCMQGGFEKFRKKQKCIAIISSVILGIAMALFAFGLTMHLSKLNKTRLHLVLYVLIPVAGFLLVASVSYVLFRKKDKEVANRIDEKYAFNDRAKTMIEHQGEDSDMVRLQREDTQERLKSLSLGKYSWKGLWVCLLAFALSVAMLFTGIFIPKQYNEDNVVDDTTPPPPTIEFEITQDQKIKLEMLIKKVEGSKAEDAVRGAITSELKPLLQNIDEIETAEDLYTELVRIILSIDAFVENHNTYKRVYKPIRLSEIETVQTFAIGIGLNDWTLRFADMKKSFENEEEYNVSTLACLNEFVTELKARFAEVHEEDKGALTDAIEKLIVDVETVSLFDPITYTYDYILGEIDVAFNNNVKPLAEALTQQTENRAVTTATIKELISIFSIPAEWIPEWGGEPLEGLDLSEPPQDKPLKPGEGIIIDGIQYPSNETVYDYFTKVICEYGKVFEGDAYNYKAAINQLLSEGIANGTIDPELEEMIREYLEEISGKDPIVGGGN